jgi:membrane protease YdiL (CAAX protease family)
MTGLVELVRKKPVISFYLLCYSVSWSLWLPLILAGGELSELLAVIGVFGGPPIACILVARILPPSTQVAPARASRPTFLVAWIVCTLIFSLYQRATSVVASPVAYVIYAVLALIPALVVTSAFSGPLGVRATLSSLIRPRGWWGWYAAALLLPVVMRAVSVWISQGLGWELLSNPELPSTLPELAGSVVVVFLYTLVYAGGLNEETGWTGFGLPRLQASLNPVIATILVWGLWILWHVPLHMAGYFDLSPHVLIGSFFGRFLLTWLFIRSSGGILTAMLLHTSVNVTSQFVPLTNASLMLDAVVAAVVIIGGKMWRRLPEGDPATAAGQPSLQGIGSLSRRTQR